jgi:hypothetical protein
LPKVIFVVYIHVHYSIYVIYLWILKLYHARPSSHARLCMLFLINAGIVSKLKEAMSKWRKYSKADTEEERKTFLQNKSTTIAEEKNTTMEKIMKQLRLRDAKKRSASQIKMVRGKL